MGGRDERPLCCVTLYCFVSLSLQKFRCGFKCTTPRPGGPQEGEVPRGHCLVGNADLLRWEGGAVGLPGWGCSADAPPPPPPGVAPRRSRPCLAQQVLPGLEAERWMPVPAPLGRLLESPSPECRAERAKVIVQQTGWQGQATCGAVGRSPDVPSRASRSTGQEGGWCGPSRMRRRKALQTGS